MLPSKLAKNYVPLTENKVLNEFEELDFSNDIINEAYDIWQEIKINNKKDTCRRMLKFYCVYIAHMRLNVVQDLEHIAERLNIDKKKATRSFIDFSESKTGFKLPSFQFEVKDFLKLYIDKLDIESYHDDIFSILHDIKKSPNVDDKKKILLCNKPQNVAAAIIDYQYSKTGNLMRAHDYKRIHKKKETVNPVKTGISMLLHSTD